MRSLHTDLAVAWAFLSGSHSQLYIYFENGPKTINPTVPYDACTMKYAISTVVKKALLGERFHVLTTRKEPSSSVFNTPTKPNTQSRNSNQPIWTSHLSSHRALVASSTLMRRACCGEEQSNSRMAVVLLLPWRGISKLHTGAAEHPAL